jgi:hypothetical protein
VGCGIALEASGGLLELGKMTGDMGTTLGAWDGLAFAVNALELWCGGVASGRFCRGVAGLLKRDELGSSTSASFSGGKGGSGAGIGGSTDTGAAGETNCGGSGSSSVKSMVSCEYCLRGEVSACSIFA